MTGIDFSLMDFTLEDVGDPMLFTVRVTRHRLSGMQAELDLLLVLLGVLKRARPTTKASLGKARRAVGAARQQLLGVGDDMERALRPTSALYPASYRNKPIELAREEKGDPVRSTLKATRERMVRVQGELDMLLVLLLVFGRRQHVGRRRLAQAKRAVREARGEFVEARAQVERAFTGELDPDGELELAGQTS